MASFKLIDSLPNLSIAQKTQLASHFSRREYAAEDYLFFEGDSPAQLWFVEEGRVKLLKHSDMGKDVIVMLVSAGEFLGESAIQEKSPYPVTAQAFGPAVMLTLSGEACRDMMHLYPDLSLWIINRLGCRLDEAYETIRSLAVERVERRIARLLLKLAASVGRSAGQDIVIDMPLTRQDIAEMTGTTVESAIRVMSKFRKQGFVASKNGKIHLTEPHALVVLADELQT
jgi:CRP-like cAMP-binding protein